MSDAAATVLERVRAGGLLAPGRPVVVLLSGGRDSVCLLDVAVSLLGAAAVRALHLNYGLRDAAAGEEARCRELCARFGVALAVRRPRRRGDPPGDAGGSSGNLQAWAREQRYAEARRLALESDARIATGHTASDQAETVLYRLAASPGRRALLGMAARDGRLVRPLLSITREETAAHCSARGLAWVEDGSNADPAFARSRVRHGLLPALRAVHPAAERSIVRTAEILREEGEVLDRLVADAIAEPGADSRERLASLPRALARLVVRRLAEDAAGAPVPAAAARLDELLALGAAGGSAALDLGGGVRAIAEYGRLRFACGPPPDGPPVAAVELGIPGRVRFGEWEVSVEVPVCPATPGPGVVDRDALGETVVVRRWRPGDRMAPLGLGGTRTLQDLFVDRRVPRERRAGTPVVESDGEIAWVPGLATSDRFRVGAHTRRTARLRARREPGAGAVAPTLLSDA